MTVEHVKAITEILADGKFHSGEQIAGQLDITRTSVWKKIQAVKERYEIDIHAVSGRGYRLPDGIDLLDENLISSRLSESVHSDISPLYVFDQIESTNQFLLDCDEIGEDAFAVCLAEMQTRGRGRRGRQWMSPFGRNIQLSIACHLNMPMSKLAGLSVAVGVAVADSISEIGLPQVALKWPNDIHVNEKKLAGLLVEIKGEAEGPVKTVIGVGLNVDLPSQLIEQIDQPVTDLSSNMAGSLPVRNDIAIILIEKVTQAVREFTYKGMDDFVQRWKQYDVYLDQQVTIKNASSQVEGIYRGLDATGGLLLENHQGITVYNAGEVSMRAGAGS